MKANFRTSFGHALSWRAVLLFLSLFLLLFSFLLLGAALIMAHRRTNNTDTVTGAGVVSIRVITASVPTNTTDTVTGAVSMTASTC